jgi:preprotein translocase subunit SecG
MYGLILTLHFLICFGLVIVVLLQSGKGGGLAGGAFGGTAQTVFGGRGATDFVTRATMVLGGAFFLTSLTLALMTSGTGRGTRSLLQEEARRATQTAPQQVPGQVPSGQAPGAPAPTTAPPASSPPPSGSPTPPSGNR